MQLIERPTIITLCGSTKFLKEEREVYFNETQKGNIVLSHSGRRVESKVTGRMLDRLHFRKIDLADSIFVINIDGYIGESTRREIEYAEKQGKPVTYLEPVEGTTSKKGKGDRLTESRNKETSKTCISHRTLL